MDLSNKLLDLFKDLSEQIPSLLTILVCIVVALVKLRRYPKVSLITLVALILLFLQAIVFAIIYTWAPDALIEAASAGDRSSVTANVYLILGVITNIALAVSFALLLTAIFIQRPSRT